ncbi:MAG: M23 family metallopeptidase [Acidobacteriota bacterium]
MSRSSNETNRWEGKIINEFKVTSQWQPPSTTPKNYRKLVGFKPARHTGIDLKAPLGTPVYSVSSGQVSVKYIIDKGNPCSKYGKHVIVNSGKYLYLYAHLSKITVEDGALVKTGTKIGEIGSTGRSLGPHLHFEVRDRVTGLDVDPKPRMRVILQNAPGHLKQQF